MLTHHSRGLSGHFNWVSSVGDGHLRSVHDVQAGIQNPIVKLEGEKKNCDFNNKCLIVLWCTITCP